MRYRLFLRFVFGLIVAVLGVGMVSAQQPIAYLVSSAVIPSVTSTPAPPIEVRGSVSGLINALQSVYRFQYAGKKGDRIALMLQSPTLDIDLVFYGLNEAGLIFKALSVRGGKAARLPFTVPADGVYLIVITPAKAGTGKFALTIGLDSDANNAVEAIPTLDLSGQVIMMINRWQKAGLIPDGGKQIISVPNGFGTTSDPGYSIVTIERGLSVGDMVLNYQVGWLSAGATSGCGFMFHTVDGNFSMVLLHQDGQVALIQRQGDQNSTDYERSSELFKPGSFTTVTLIALGDKVSLYLNGKLETTQKFEPSKGGFAINVYNPADNTVVTDCRFRNIWVWSLD